MKLQSTVATLKLRTDGLYSLIVYFKTQHLDIKKR